MSMQRTKPITVLEYFSTKFILTNWQMDMEGECASYRERCNMELLDFLHESYGIKKVNNWIDDNRERVIDDVCWDGFELMSEEVYTYPDNLQDLVQ
jgi:hypothetical protein